MIVRLYPQDAWYAAAVNHLIEGLSNDLATAQLEMIQVEEATGLVHVSLSGRLDSERLWTNNFALSDTDLRDEQALGRARDATVKSVTDYINNQT